MPPGPPSNTDSTQKHEVEASVPFWVPPGPPSNTDSTQKHEVGGAHVPLSAGSVTFALRPSCWDLLNLAAEPLSS